jgi:hypothetical protein
LREDCLTLQIRFVNFVVVDNAYTPNAGCRKILQRRRTEAAGTYDERPRRAQPLLSG